MTKTTKQTNQLQKATLLIAEKVLATQNLTDLFEAIHGIVKTLMPADNFYIALYDKEKNIISFPYSVDEDESQPESKPFGKGLTEYVLKTKKALLATPSIFKQLLKEGSVELIGKPSIDWLGVPLGLEENISGVLAVQSYRGDLRYTKHHLEILEFVSTQIALAIQRKWDEEKLRLLSRAIQQNPASVIITDLNGTIEYVNPKFSEVTGYSFQEAIGANPRILKSGKQSSSFYKKMWQTILSGKEWRGEFENRKKNGELFWEYAHIAPVMNEKGEITNFIAMKEDITERKQVEQLAQQRLDELTQSRIALLNMLDDANQARLKAEEAQQELENANKTLTQLNRQAQITMRDLEATQHDLKLALDAAEESDRLKSEFLANTSHELRTPLNSIIGFLQLLRDKLYESPEEEQEFITSAIQSSRQLLQKINDVLDIAKIQAEEIKVSPAEVSVIDIFDEVLLLMYPAANEKNLTLEYHLYEDQDFTMFLDRQKIKQIMQNLVSNAIKFNPKGRIDLYARAYDKLGYGEIIVQDTGIGIPVEKQKNIFNAFVQGDGTSSRKFGGTGLGLSITKGLTELMGGTIQMESEGVNKGTRVRLTFPLKNPRNSESSRT